MDDASGPQLGDGPGQRASTVKSLIRDRAGEFTGSFDAAFTAEGIRILASPPQPPRANAIYERVIGTLRRELLDRLLIINEQHLRRAPTDYLTALQHPPGRTAPPASSPRHKQALGRPNRSTLPSTGSAASRFSADSPTSTTSLPKCPQGEPESHFRAPQDSPTCSE